MKKYFDDSVIAEVIAMIVYKGFVTLVILSLIVFTFIQLMEV